MPKFEIIFTSIVGSIALAMLDFSLFFQDPKTAFVIHNTLSAFVGLGLLVFGLRLYTKDQENRYLHSAIFLIGLYMIAVHITKLVIGKVF